MTSNQIAYAQQVESARHNSEYEAETERHNVATEKLTEKQLGIEQQKADADEMYKRNSLRIQEEYNKWYARYTSANEAEKRKIDQKLADIRKQQADSESAYRVQMVELERIANDIQRGLAEEKARNNQAIETINAYSAMQTAWMKERELEYKKHELDVESGLKRQELNILQFKNDTDASLKAAALNWQQHTEEYLNELTRARAEDTKSQTTWRPWHEVSEPFLNILEHLFAR